jgi:hypothetical protein
MWHIPISFAISPNKAEQTYLLLNYSVSQPYLNPCHFLSLTEAMSLSQSESALELSFI